MIDIFAILLSHGLILVVAWRLLFREDLDTEMPEADKPARPWLKDRGPSGEASRDA